MLAPDYNIFHSIAEYFSIFISIAIFFFVWQKRKSFKNDYLLFVGIAYLFVGGIDFIHTLAYKGMNIFSGYEGANLSVQLWIIARYVQAISLLVAPIFITKKLWPKFTMFIYAILSIFLMWTAFAGIFPDTFLEGSGLTYFKIFSEYIISAILFLALLTFLQYRDMFKLETLYLIVASIGFTVLSELSFTFYISVFGLSNFFGHIFKVIAFFLFFKAIFIMKDELLSKPEKKVKKNKKVKIS